jgi:hypothetical protein
MWNGTARSVWRAWLTTHDEDTTKEKDAPKLIDYGRALADYFTKNGGLSTAMGALVPAIVQAVSVGDLAIAQVIAQSFDPDTVATIQHGARACSLRW